MGAKDTSSGAANQGNDVGNTRKLIERVIHTGVPGRTHLFDDVERTNGKREFDPSELIEFSVKMSSRGFSQNQYCAPLTWTPGERGAIASRIHEAAPTDVLRDILTPPNVDEEDKRKSMTKAQREQDDGRRVLLETIGRTARYFSCVVHDFDAKTYGVWFFKPRPTRDQDTIDLTRRAEDLQTLADIRGVEIDMDDPLRTTTPVYFRVKLPDKQDGSETRPLDILDEAYSPHPWLAPRLLQTPNRKEIVDPLRQMLSNVALVREPVVKLVPPKSTLSSGAFTMDDWRDAPYDVHVCVLDENHTVFLDDHRVSILAIAQAFGCKNAALAWLEAIDPFDCFMSRLEVGPDSVVFHYRSTPFHKRKRVAHRVRGKKTNNASDVPGAV